MVDRVLWPQRVYWAQADVFKVLCTGSSSRIEFMLRTLGLLNHWTPSTNTNHLIQNAKSSMMCRRIQMEAPNICQKKKTRWKSCSKVRHDWYGEMSFALCLCYWFRKKRSWLSHHSCYPYLFFPNFYMRWDSFYPNCTVTEGTHYKSSSIQSFICASLKIMCLVLCVKATAKLLSLCS